MMTAHVLSRYCKEVFLFEDQDNSAIKRKKRRVFAVNLLSEYMFQKHKIWMNLDQSLINPFDRIAVFDTYSSSTIDFNSTDISHDRLGHIIDESNLVSQLNDQIKKNTSINILKKYKIHTISSNNKNAQINEDKKLTFDLLINTSKNLDCIYSDKLFIRKIQDYNQTAYCFNIEVLKDFYNIAFQRFDRDEIYGLLPVNKNNFNLIWSMSNNNFTKIKKLDDLLLKDHISDSLFPLIGEIKSISDPISFPLKNIVINKYAQNKIMLLGDAAHVLHPMAGLGMNIGIQDLFFLEYAIENLKDINDIIRFYSKNGHISSFKFNQTINILKSFYSTNVFPKIIKKLSFKIFNNSKIIKSHTIREATGINILEANLGSNYTKTYYQHNNTKR